MKSRKKVTSKIRNNWVENYEKNNQKGEHYLSYLKTQDFVSKGAKNRTPDYMNKGQDRNLF